MRAELFMSEFSMETKLVHAGERSAEPIGNPMGNLRIAFIIRYPPI